MKVTVKAYRSPTLVLLAFDWPDGNGRSDFLGFAIERTPGFNGTPKSWLPNRIGFDGPKPDQSDFSSDEAPIQKFYWWDARFDTKDRGTSFSYRVIPVGGTRDSLALLEDNAGTIDVEIPLVEEHGITTHFNRAVVSSQAFAKQFPQVKTDSQIRSAQAWLANGMESAVPDFLERADGKSIEGAIYHLTDETWIIPALLQYTGPVSLAYNQTSKDHDSDEGVRQLVTGGKPEESFHARTHAHIMHDKFLVRVNGAEQPEAVLTGSANFTAEGLSVQANVLHAFESSELAALYLAKKRELDDNPALSATQAAQKGWSEKITVGDAKIRAFFPPESKNQRTSLDTIINAIEAAQHSVLLCAFDPTDGTLLDALFSAADKGRMALALVNRVPEKQPAGNPAHADVAAAIAIMDRAVKNHDITGFSAFKPTDTPTGFLPEHVLWPGENPKIKVRVHHKFVIIDAEGKNPVIFTGSANFSDNSTHGNDENLLEITECPRLAAIYLAEFMRLYEHYRARAVFERRQAGEKQKFKLTADNSWSKKYFKEGSPEAKARIAMAGSE